MRKLIVVYQGVSQSAVLNNILSVSGVNDALTVDVIDAAIVDTAPGQEQQVKSQLQSLSGVATVYEEIQAVPLIADESELQSTLSGLADERGYEIPLPDDTPEFDTKAESPDPNAELSSIDDSLAEIGVPDIHDSGATGVTARKQNRLSTQCKSQMRIISGQAAMSHEDVAVDVVVRIKMESMDQTALMKQSLLLQQDEEGTQTPSKATRLAVQGHVEVKNRTSQHRYTGLSHTAMTAKTLATEVERPGRLHKSPE